MNLTHTGYVRSREKKRTFEQIAKRISTINIKISKKKEKVLLGTKTDMKLWRTMIIHGLNEYETRREIVEKPIC